MHVIAGLYGNVKNGTYATEGQTAEGPPFMMRAATHIEGLCDREMERMACRCQCAW